MEQGAACQRNDQHRPMIAAQAGAVTTRRTIHRTLSISARKQLEVDRHVPHAGPTGLRTEQIMQQQQGDITWATLGTPGTDSVPATDEPAQRQTSRMPASPHRHHQPEVSPAQFLRWPGGGEHPVRRKAHCAEKAAMTRKTCTATRPYSLNHEIADGAIGNATSTSDHRTQVMKNDELRRNRLEGVDQDKTTGPAAHCVGIHQSRRIGPSYRQPGRLVRGFYPFGSDAGSARCNKVGRVAVPARAIVMVLQCWGLELRPLEEETWTFTMASRRGRLTARPTKHASSRKEASSRLAGLPTGSPNVARNDCACWSSNDAHPPDRHCLQ